MNIRPQRQVTASNDPGGTSIISPSERRNSMLLRLRSRAFWRATSSISGVISVASTKPAEPPDSPAGLGGLERVSSPPPQHAGACAGSSSRLWGPAAGRKVIVQDQVIDPAHPPRELSVVPD